MITDSEQQAALEQDPIGIVFDTEFDFDDGTQYITNGPGDVTYGGNTYMSVGELGAIDTIEEAGDGKPSGLRMSLALPQGLDDPGTVVNSALSTPIRGRSYRVRVRIYNADGTQATADPILVSAGQMDFVAVTDSDEGEVLELQCETAAADLLRPNGSRYTDADQQALFPGDRFFEYLPLTGRTIQLGDGSTRSGTRCGGGGGLSPTDEVRPEPL
ncbi:MAG: hypothetical protein AAGA95_10255 [Pseudomonadota bacterium]